MNPQMINALLAVLAGAGFEKFSKGSKALADSGQDVSSVLSLPNAPLFLAGAGIRDVGNSMEAFGPLLAAFAPPKQPEPESSPQQVGAAMKMLSARLGEGIQGLQLPGAPQAGY